MGRRGRLARLALLVAVLVTAAVWILTARGQRSERATTALPVPGAKPVEAPPADGRVAPPVAEPPLPSPPPRKSPPEFPSPDRMDPPPHGVLLVHVLSSRGEPARGATVRAYVFARVRPAGGGPTATDVTDAGGQVRFEFTTRDVIHLQVEWQDEVGAASAGISSEGDNDVVIRMERTLPVVGKVVDADGRPVEGAEVVLSLAGVIRGRESFEAAYVGVTDGTGCIRIPAREIDAKPYYRVVARGFRTTWGELDRSRLLDEGFEVRLERVASVSGRFLDAAGDGVARVSVSVLETMQSSLSDADGRFEVEGLPPEGGTLIVQPREHGRLILRDVRPTSGRADIGDVVLGPGLEISGRVRLPDGAPAKGIDVTTRCGISGFPARSSETDESGRFVMTGFSEGTYSLSAWSRDRDEAGRNLLSAEIRDVPGGTKDLDIVLQPRPLLTLEFVSAETGAEAWVLSVEVRASLRGTSETASIILNSPRKRRTNRAWLFLDQPGEYDVVVITPGCSDQLVRVALEEGESKTVTVRLPRVE